MQNVPALNSNSATMSSREIAELTDKRHDHVLGDIRRILSEVGIDSTRFEGVYKDQQDINRPCFNLPKRECDLVIAGYSAKYRLAIIDRWQELEAKEKTNMVILPDFTNPAIAARAWAEQFEARQIAEQKNIDDAPKVEFALAVRNLEGSCSVGEFAALIGMGRNTFFKQLRADKILMISNRPYQEYKDRGLLVEIESTPYTDHNGIAQPAFQTRVTRKGQIWLEKKYRKDAK